MFTFVSAHIEQLEIKDAWKRHAPFLGTEHQILAVSGVDQEMLRTKSHISVRRDLSALKLISRNDGSGSSFGRKRPRTNRTRRRTDGTKWWESPA